jgi:biopolymer transport protein ExbD
MTKDRDRFEEVKPDMTPMIDVTFLLLIFFIVTLKFRVLEGRLDAALPKDRGAASSKVDEIEKVDILITVGNPGAMLPDPSTSTPNWPNGRLRHLRGRVLKVALGTNQFLVRTDIDENKDGFLDDLVKLGKALKPFDKDETPVTIDPRKGIVYSDVIAILDLVIQQGFLKVSFAGSLEND